MKKNKLKNNKQKKFFLQKENGFVILFTVVLSSIILAVTLGVANIAQKELSFSTSAKSTNEAFFAADAGAECALYYDLVGTESFFGNINPYGTETPVLVKCAGTDIDLYQGISFDPNASTPTTATWVFPVYPLGAEGSACAIVSVTKKTVPASTYIVSKGYNLGGDISSDCTSLSSNRVERQIELIY